MTNEEATYRPKYLSLDTIRVDLKLQHRRDKIYCSTKTNIVQENWKIIQKFAQIVL